MEGSQDPWLFQCQKLAAHEMCFLQNHHMWGVQFEVLEEYSPLKFRVEPPNVPGQYIEGGGVTHCHCVMVCGGKGGVTYRAQVYISGEARIQGACTRRNHDQWKTK